MKKHLLLFLLLLSATIQAQGLNQPWQSNNVCDDNNDGFSVFNLQAITAEILSGLPAQDYVVTHHSIQADAQAGVNPLPANYVNVFNHEVIYVRIVNTVTSNIQFTSYVLNVNPTPQTPAVALTNCINNNGQICWNLTSVVTTDATQSAAFFQTQADAQSNTNQITIPTCYVSLVASPTIPPVYYKITSNLGCASIGTIQLVTVNCNQGGQPQNLVQCLDSASQNACFNLLDNNVNVIGSLNPSEYTITYHLSQSEAASDSNPLSSPYCMLAMGTQQLFARLENNITLSGSVSSFSITSQMVSPNVLVLQDMVQCDDNLDGTVTFDLTTIQAQISTTNTLEYYTSLPNATNQVVPITTPNVLNVSITTPVTSIFVREVINGTCDTIYSFKVKAFANCNLAYTCSQANSLCGALGNPFNNTIQVPSSGSSGCLGSTPNPTWFYLPISQAGNINLMIQQSTSIDFAVNNLDVDYAIYGPFTDPVTACGTGMPLPNTIVSCSFSTAAVEFPTIPNALSGQYYLIMVTNFSNQPGFIKITELSGNSQGGLDCTGLRLNAFLDSNSNGTQDNGEQNFPLGQFHYEVNNNGNIHHITAPTGIYNIYEMNPTNSYDLSFSIDPIYAPMYNITTASYADISVVVGGGMVVYNFPITINQPYNDLAVVIVPTQQPRAGFAYENKIAYANLGNQIVPSGTLTFNLDSALTISNISQSGTTVNSSGFTYNFTNLLPFEYRIITVTMQVPPIPTVAIGQLVNNSASIIPLSNDVSPLNNASAVTQAIIASYDPNDKVESHGEEILVSNFTSDDYLYYTIRFENTGNASALNVKINDVLDAQLDETSIRMVSASHSYTLDRVGNSLTWEFDNIQLAPSVANTPIGKGYVSFMVKPKPGYAAGDIIPNIASIYFDFNPAIITNTFQTKFVTQLAVNEFENGDFIFYPNPVNDKVTVSLKNNLDTLKEVAVYDVLGKQILVKTFNTNAISEVIDLSSIRSGMYFIEVTTANNLKIAKKLIVN